MCCLGCGAAAQWIADAGLADYYRLRSAEGSRVAADAGDFSAWDRADVQAGHVVDGAAGKEITVVVEGMRCAACAWLIDRALCRSPGAAEVTANAVTGRVRIAWDPAATTLSGLLARLAALGYTPHLAAGESAERARRRERNLAIARLGVAALGAMQAMMFAEALYLDSAREMAPATRDFFRWIAFLVSTPVVFYSGWPFLAGMARELRARAPGMDFLVGGSVLLAYLASLAETIRQGPDVWYDAAVMFVFFLLAARFLERMARRSASARLDALARAQPALAWRETDDGTREQVPVSELRPGDIVRLATGEVAPADGVLASAGAAFDESLLTGEPDAVAKATGDAVFAGSACRGMEARLRVARIGPETRLSQLARLVERAQSQRPRAARLADAVARRFVLGLLVAAVVVAGVWLQIDPDRAFEITLSVLVVSCPCALSLAVPAALASAHGALAARGVLAISDDALERLASVDTVVLDKTGTLTRGEPGLLATQIFGEEDEDEMRALAAALEAGSSHPLARAFGDDAPRAASELRSVPGLGVEGRIGEVVYRLGRADFVGTGADDGAIWLGAGGFALARFEVADTPRPEAAAMLEALRAQGMAIEVLSGDAEEPVTALCMQLGIDRCTARQSPEDKLARVHELQVAGHRVLMVGDGLNDAPVLAGADVSVALARGADLAHRAASLVLTGATLAPLADAIALARRARHIVRQNLAWAVAYNVVALPLAAAGLATPALAALGMAASSLLVTLNALRLGRIPKARP